MLSENYQVVTNKIKEAMLRAGRSDAVELLAASKTQSIDTVREAYALGIRVFGENRVQELTDKYTPEFTWDMIGQLQTNKVKYLVGAVRLIQSVDRLSLVDAIDKEAKKKGVVQKILVEVNGGEEEDKGGVYPAHTLEMLKTASEFKNVEVKGIMAVMPKSDDEAYLRSLYRRLGDVREEILSYNRDWSLYSAGMTNDYHIAVEYGANIIRLGRALFGERQ